MKKYSENEILIQTAALFFKNKTSNKIYHKHKVTDEAIAFVLFLYFSIHKTFIYLMRTPCNYVNISTEEFLKKKNYSSSNEKLRWYFNLQLK